MPDAITALLNLQAAPRENLTRMIYNVGAFHPSALNIFQIIQKAFPNSDVAFASDYRRQAIIDSWPADVEDSAARNDWGWQPTLQSGKSVYGIFNSRSPETIRSEGITILPFEVKKIF